MKAFDTTDTMVYTVRKKLVEEGLDAVLSRKRRETPPVARIFDGEREARLMALACFDPPPGSPVGPCGCWKRRSWNCGSSTGGQQHIRRVLKNVLSLISGVLGHSAEANTALSQ